MCDCCWDKLICLPTFQFSWREYTTIPNRLRACVNIIQLCKHSKLRRNRRVTSGAFNLLLSQMVAKALHASVPNWVKLLTCRRGYWSSHPVVPVRALLVDQCWCKCSILTSVTCWVGSWSRRVPAGPRPGHHVQPSRCPSEIPSLQCWSTLCNYSKPGRKTGVTLLAVIVCTEKRKYHRPEQQQIG